MFKRVWTPVTEQSLQVRAGTGNKHDSYAVATIHNSLSTCAIVVPKSLVHLETKTAVYYLRCLAEIRGNITYLSEGCRKIRCRIFRRNTVSGDCEFAILETPKCAPISLLRLQSRDYVT